MIAHPTRIPEASAPLSSGVRDLYVGEKEGETEGVGEFEGVLEGVGEFEGVLEGVGDFEGVRDGVGDDDEM